MLDILVCIVLLLYVIPLFLGCHFNVGNFVGIALFGSVLVFLYHPHIWFELPIIVRFMIGICLVVFLICALYTGYFMYVACQKKPIGKETVILLGCGLYGSRPSLSLIQRMEVAIEYLNTYPATNVIVAGGKGRGENITEAKAMYTYLTSKGIDSHRIYLEEKSVNTKQNIQYAHNILQQHNLNKEVVIVTHAYHMYRAMQFVKQEKLSFHACAAKSSWYAFPMCATREIIAIWVWNLRIKYTK